MAALNLDDYLVRTYRGENGTVDLYVGYYFGHEKVGAAHSPLVCFPGQGWEVSDTEPFVIPFGPDEAQKIHASAMTVRKGERSELVVYWFQAHERTSGDTFRQKVHTLYNRFSRKGEANAFVRVSVPVVEGDVAGARRTVFAFVQAFYPMFVRYVTST